MADREQLDIAPYRVVRCHDGSTAPEELDLAMEERRRRRLDDDENLVWGSRASDARPPVRRLDAIAVVLYVAMALVGAAIFVGVLTGVIG